MKRQHRQTVALDPETHELLNQLRGQLSHGEIQPSDAAILRIAIARGLTSIAREVPAAGRKRST